MDVPARHMIKTLGRLGEQTNTARAKHSHSVMLSIQSEKAC